MYRYYVGLLMKGYYGPHLKILIVTVVVLNLFGAELLLYISFIDALFTSTSAMTVTGLIVLDTATAFMMFGQMVIMLLIQFGGLGIMTCAAVVIYIAVGKKIRLKHRLIIKQDLNQCRSVVW
ncbi:potassium transporter TrkG [Halobacillus trueperi]|uniref:potassium transporter TrkG n=1 Tax=Halobacillus trueperi TaxID=156205 RepID=UPI001FC9EDE8|nr:potassium transporter TrkG [Halobacillus trueperi]